MTGQHVFPAFWHSDLGEISGTPEESFTRTFDIIPDSTMAIAQIESVLNDDFAGSQLKTIKIDWVITSGDFTGQHVFQKIKCYDEDPKVRHKALNTLKLIYNMYNLKPTHANAPTDQDLAVFVKKSAGIKIQEWSMTRADGTTGHGNFVSEIHPASGFTCVTGKRKDFAPVPPKHHNLESALTRNHRANNIAELDDDIPF